MTPKPEQLRVVVKALDAVDPATTVRILGIADGMVICLVRVPNPRPKRRTTMV